MKCGELGHRTAQGELCQQNIATKAKGCLWHRRNPEERSLLATKGAMAAKMKSVLPATFPVPALTNVDDVKAFVRELLEWVLKKPIERWRAAEARGLLGLFVSIEQVTATNRLADAVLEAQRGGPAVMLLNQYLTAQPSGRRRRLPGVAPEVVIPEAAHE